MLFDASSNLFRHYYGTQEMLRMSASQFQYRDGSTGTPIISFYNDTNTGIYRAGSDDMRLVAAGVSIASINANGVGIYGNNPNLTDGHVTSPSFLATGSSTGFTCENAVDYVKCRFRAEDYSYGGGIYSDGTVSILSGQNIGGTQPNIIITSGTEWSTSVTGNIDIYCGYTYYGTAGSINIKASTADGSYGGNAAIAGGDTNSGGYTGGVLSLSGGSDWSGVGYGGDVFIDGGSGSSYGNVQINNSLGGTTYINTSNGGTVQILSNSASSYLGFYGVTPVNQQSPFNITAATLTGGAGTTVTDTDTFDGYTIAQVVGALRAYGLLA
jgi:hypothetical protein